MKYVIPLKTRQLMADFFLFSLGVMSAAFGLKGFLLPNLFIDGGVTGISLILSDVTGSPLSILLVGVNLPFIILGYSQLGKSFAVKSSLAIIGLALTVHFFTFPVITSDKLLVAAFGGFFLGAGIGLSIRGGAVLDGTEVLAIYLSRKTGVKIGDVILIFNVVIFAAGAYFMSIEVALYAILTYIAASKTIDYIIHGIEEYTGVTVISPQSEEIRIMIVEKMGRGVTIYQGKGGYENDGANLTPCDIIFTVLTRLEVAKLEDEVKIIDPSAFIIMGSIKDTRGGMIKKMRTLKI